MVSPRAATCIPVATSLGSPLYHTHMDEARTSGCQALRCCAASCQHGPKMSATASSGPRRQVDLPCRQQRLFASAPLLGVAPTHDRFGWVERLGPGQMAGPTVRLLASPFPKKWESVFPSSRPGRASGERTPLVLRSLSRCCILDHGTEPTTLQSAALATRAPWHTSAPMLHGWDTATSRPSAALERYTGGRPPSRCDGSVGTSLGIHHNFQDLEVGLRSEASPVCQGDAVLAAIRADRAPPRSGRSPPKFGRGWLKSGRTIWLNMAHIWPKSRQIWPTLDQI